MTSAPLVIEVESINTNGYTIVTAPAVSAIYNAAIISRVLNDLLPTFGIMAILVYPLPAENRRSLSILSWYIVNPTSILPIIQASEVASPNLRYINALYQISRPIT